MRRSSAASNASRRHLRLRTHEDRHRRALLLVVLGRGGGALRESSRGAACTRSRREDRHGPRPAGRDDAIPPPRSGRHGDLPAHIIPVGRSVVVPANGSLPNIVLSPRSIRRVRAVLREERFDIVHLHEPFTPTICVAALAFAECPSVATWHAAGDLAWMRAARPVWGFLMDRLETRIAVSRLAAESAERWVGPEFEIIPNGVVVPLHAD